MATYMLHPLDDCFERVKRAREHFEQLHRDIIEAISRQAYSIPIEYEIDPPHRFKRQLPPETFYGMRIAILFGEICYNLRSALDYLVFHLSELDSSSPQDGTQFPIEDKAKGFAHRVKRGWLNGVNAVHITAIERLQPYNGCNWTARLRDCSNLDKHRKFVQHLGHSSITVWHGFETDLIRIDGLIRRAIHPVHGQVQVKVHIASNITLSDGTSVIEAVNEIQAGVAQTLTDFYPEF